MITDTTERGLERLICQSLTGIPCDPPAGPTVGDPISSRDGVGWTPGNHHDYDRVHCLDLVQLRAFLEATQPDTARALQLDQDCFK